MMDGLLVGALRARRFLEFLALSSRRSRPTRSVFRVFSDTLLGRMTMHAHRIMIAAALAALMATPSASAQWLKQPTPGMPRTPDGKPKLDAPAPRTADGKMDPSGLWL